MLFQGYKPYFKSFNLSNSKYIFTPITLFPYCLYGGITLYK